VSGSETWTEVDRYVGGLLAPDDAARAAAAAAADDAGMPAIQVTPAQAKLLYLLAKTIGARRVLEFGTLAGYSTIWLARSLPDDGRLITLEHEPRHAEVARANIARAGVEELVDLRVGAALDSLSGLDGEEPFDLVFIDADKANTPAYYQWSLERVRSGGLIVADNVVRDGSLADLDDESDATVAQRRLHELLAAESRVEATTIQTVGAKGYDGFTLIRVN
jgi:predicted O-methyltransferase YrrM